MTVPRRATRRMDRKKIGHTDEKENGRVFDVHQVEEAIAAAHFKHPLLIGVHKYLEEMGPGGWPLDLNHFDLDIWPVSVIIL